MSHFYGIIEGQAKTQATRTGSKFSGLETHCASQQGAIRCVAYIDENEIDCVLIEKTTWQGKGKYKLLYEGPIGIEPQSIP